MLLVFCLLDTARVTFRRTSAENTPLSDWPVFCGAFSQLLTDMGKYTHIRPSPGPPLDKVVQEGIRKQAEQASKKHSSLFSALVPSLVPSITVGARKGSVALLNHGQGC